MDPEPGQLLSSHHLIYISQVRAGRLENNDSHWQQVGNKSDGFSDWGLQPGYSLIRTWSKLWQLVLQRSSEQWRALNHKWWWMIQKATHFRFGRNDQQWVRCGPNCFKKKKKSKTLEYMMVLFPSLLELYVSSLWGNHKVWWYGKDLSYRPGCLFLPPWWCEPWVNCSAHWDLFPSYIKWQGYIIFSWYY